MSWRRRIEFVLRFEFASARSRKEAVSIGDNIVTGADDRVDIGPGQLTMPLHKIATVRAKTVFRRNIRLGIMLNYPPLTQLRSFARGLYRDRLILRMIAVLEPLGGL